MGKMPKSRAKGPFDPVRVQSLLDKITAEARRHSKLSRRGPGKNIAWIIDCALATPSRIAKLNSQHLGKDGATDILSFPSPEPFYSQGHLGFLVLCPAVARKQAKSLGLPEKTELQVLLVHGILHLLGFDHERSSQARIEMAGWEKKLLRATLAASETGILGLTARARTAK